MSRREKGAGVRQASLARLADFGVVPKRRLGQNFLIDDNILSVIIGRLEPRPEDVVLEVGAGLGVLTRALAECATRVHAFEIDRSLEAPLKATLGPLAAKVEIHLADVLQSPMEDLLPPPTLCASNLPYAPAAPFLAEALDRLPNVRRYVVMVQREVAERIAAGPGSKTYGSLSVWIQLHASVVEVRSLSRSIFYPRPNVDSSLLTLERRLLEPAVEDLAPVLRQTIDAAFAQRRKSVANALAAGLHLSKGQVSGLLESLAIPPGNRAEQLSPETFLRLAKALKFLLLSGVLPEQRLK
jgi:16S rRNA (adenine1518-N6/adenine1519-N6)-dimethyltransferase